MNKEEIRDLDEIKFLLDVFKERKLQEAEHNKMIMFAAKYPTHTIIRIYFGIIKTYPNFPK